MIINYSWEWLSFAIKGGGIKKASKIRVNLIIQNFELNNLTLVVKNAIKEHD